MRFFSDGPEIPHPLLRAHEDGRVVFFCGAGVSQEEGLPGFEGLVHGIYTELGVNQENVEATACRDKRFDTVLNLLELRVVDGRHRVRRATQTILTPKADSPRADGSHSALLDLALARQVSDAPARVTRLVTTNFDRLFELAAASDGKQLREYAAPLLPVPKTGRWDGVVHLHGCLPKDDDEGALDRLVLTSTDFGLAYLVEGWATRFVVELFRNYVVCFVGYAIDDPILRYMTDALAAERAQDGPDDRVFAFADYSGTEQDKARVAWRAKGVTPILYDATADHSALHRSLRAWADTYRDGVQGKEGIIKAHASGNPGLKNLLNEIPTKMVWALSESTGASAQTFARQRPVPPFEWLEVFDTTPLEVAPRGAQQEESPPAHFDTLLHRTTAGGRGVVSLFGPNASDWDKTMRYLASWLLLHIDDPRLLKWFVDKRRPLHPNFGRLLERRLDELAAQPPEELEERRADAPFSVPRPELGNLWRLLLAERVQKQDTFGDLFGWTNKVDREGLTPLLRFQLRELLASRIEVSFAAFPDSIEPTPTRPRFVVRPALRTAHVRSWAKGLTPSHRTTVLPDLVDELQRLLVDLLDLLATARVGAEQNGFEWDLPSIEPHHQNRGYSDWTVLIELLRDGWITLLGTQPGRATSLARSWLALPYLPFKRLALFAASRDPGVSGEEWVSWLLAEKSYWLWAHGTHRETLRLLVKRGATLSGEAKSKLEQAILSGPAESERSINPEGSHHRTWLCLAKLLEGGASLGAIAQERFHDLRARYPSWQLRDHERDEFLVWMSGSGDPDFATGRQVDLAPRELHALVEWLKFPKRDEFPFREDDWQTVCRDDSQLAVAALEILANEGTWAEERWREALTTWSVREHAAASWPQLKDLVPRMPPPTLAKVAGSLGDWLQAIAQVGAANEQELISLCSRLMEVELSYASQSTDFLFDAVNHPFGKIAGALVTLWSRQDLKDGAGLSPRLAKVFEQLCDTTVTGFRPARLVLAANAVALYRVDRTWTERHLLPLFRWANDVVEAPYAWSGFLWAPSLYRPVLEALRDDLVTTTKHYGLLGTAAEPFARYFAHAALDVADFLPPADIRSALANLTQSGLEDLAAAIWRAVPSGRDEAAAYVRNRVLPFWRAWPQNREQRTEAVAREVAHLAVVAADAFSEVVAAVHGWLIPLADPEFVSRRLHEAGLPSSAPKDSLAFLEAIVPDQNTSVRALGWPSSLQKCLNEIAAANPTLKGDERFRRLEDVLRRYS